MARVNSLIMTVVITYLYRAQHVTAQTLAISQSTSSVSSVSSTLPTSPSLSACPLTCNDSPPPAAKNSTQFTCQEQKEYGKCNVDFMQGFCECTCDRCCPCNNYPPPRQSKTCKQLKAEGKCNKEFMLGYCECECDRCSTESTNVTVVTFEGCDVGLVPVPSKDICESTRCATNRQKCADTCGGLQQIDFDCMDSGAAFSSSCACVGTN
eukprot:TRINITY_DN297_c0_g1_i4.p2 TRINITY_DN297_c0_g1~~TRINITY_DN297_c0_g1_i4.p2  ORF type:complete len:209 (-),score=14.34 TRINITY_DN297_c0_g1_i4:299-925(-)